MILGAPLPRFKTFLAQRCAAARRTGAEDRDDYFILIPPLLGRCDITRASGL